MSASLVITIDGPAGTGKSSVAHLLAQRLGMDFLDTGAMYRAAALLALEQGLSPDGGPALAAAVQRTPPTFDWSGSPPRLLLGARDVSDRIRETDVTSIVSRVAACPEVRRQMVTWQRAAAAAHPRLVSEGRDQGSVVFPDAPLRIYLDAAPQVRARRRVEQLRLSGRDASEVEILEGILERDRIDSQRSEGPLRVPDGADRIDTSALDLEGVVEALERLARARLGERLPLPAACRSC
ncbi:MAG: Cytidylate kinase [Planctomycetota bacterium]